MLLLKTSGQLWCSTFRERLCPELLEPWDIALSHWGGPEPPSSPSTHPHPLTPPPEVSPARFLQLHTACPAHRLQGLGAAATPGPAVAPRDPRPHSVGTHSAQSRHGHAGPPRASAPPLPALVRVASAQNLLLGSWSELWLCCKGSTLQGSSTMGWDVARPALCPPAAQDRSADPERSAQCSWRSTAVPREKTYCVQFIALFLNRPNPSHFCSPGLSFQPTATTAFSMASTLPPALAAGFAPSSCTGMGLLASI